MKYGRVSDEILTLIDGEQRRSLTNTESIERVYYDYHGKKDDGEHAVDTYEYETEAMAL